ncbi:MAG: fused MFS/spermidine synthase [Hyphomicrobiales bacterium]
MPPIVLGTTAGLDHRSLRLLFSATILLSAFLLFSVQPMFVKMALPVLGGAPAVWSVAMVFFQGVLLAGYAYAHVLSKRLPQRTALLVHLAVMAAALLCLPIAMAQNFGPPPAEGQALWLFGLLTASLGLPFFAVSANGSLLQAWFARTEHPDRSDPYFLYAASNVGSFAALLSYPLALEPLLTLTAQSHLWTSGFILLAAMIAACGLCIPPGNATARTPAHLSLAPSLARRAAWTGLAFVPSGLLVAVTAHLSTDVAAAPLLWVLPLALYLLSFVVTFRAGARIPGRTLGLALLPAVALLAVSPLLPPSILWLLPLHLGVLFVAALICHQRVYELRPVSDRLTEFYLYVSLGGVLGGAFAGLIAPRVFPTVFEYPLLLAAALFCAPGVLPAARDRKTVAMRLAGVVAIAALMELAARVFPAHLPPVILPLAFLIVGSLLLAPGRFTATLAVAALTIAVPVAAASKPGLTLVRSFFGVNKVIEEQGFRKFVHGTTIHGAMRLTDASGEPLTGRPEPLTYYTNGGPLADAVDSARASAAGKTFSVGAVGLGTGSIACQARPGEHWTFFEIDAAVVRIARDPALFRFLSECLPHAPVVVGDARLTLAADKGTYDALVIDAFSSDAIPMHLLSSEAISVYASRLASGGVIAFHITNRFLDLSRVLARVAADHGLQAYLRRDPTPPDASETLRSGSKVLAIVRPDSPAAAALEGHGFHRLAPEMGRTPWTDDYANILEAIADGFRAAD